MITKEQLFSAGKIVKTHGIKGELLCFFTSQAVDYENIENILLEIEGILTPFFIAETRPRRNDLTFFMKFDGIDSENDARELVGKTIFIEKKYIKNTDEEEIEIEYLIDFQIIDKISGNLGKITEIDDSTANVLFIVENAEKQILIPFSEDYIVDIDHDNRQIFVNLPEGLVNL